MNSVHERSGLTNKRLASLLTTSLLGRTSYVYHHLSSTNSHARKLVEQGVPHGSLVIADSQMCGRGRLNRAWHSPEGVNLYCSLILTQALSPALLPWVPLATGLGVAEGVESCTSLAICLKWPNDILIGKKKLGGILCESIRQGTHGLAVIVGIGINVNAQQADFPAELQGTATSLLMEQKEEVDRLTLLATLLSKLEESYQLLHKNTISTLRKLYQSRCSTLGRHIHVQLAGGTPLEGWAYDIGMDGALHLIQGASEPPQAGKHVPTIEIRSGNVIHLR